MTRPNKIYINSLLPQIPCAEIVSCLEGGSERSGVQAHDAGGLLEGAEERLSELEHTLTQVPLSRPRGSCNDADRGPTHTWTPDAAPDLVAAESPKPSGAACSIRKMGVLKKSPTSSLPTMATHQSRSGLGFPSPDLIPKPHTTFDVTHLSAPNGSTEMGWEPGMGYHDTAMRPHVTTLLWYACVWFPDTEALA